MAFTVLVPLMANGAVYTVPAVSLGALAVQRVADRRTDVVLLSVTVWRRGVLSRQPG